MGMNAQHQSSLQQGHKGRGGTSMPVIANTVGHWPIGLTQSYNDISGNGLHLVVQYGDPAIVATGVSMNRDALKTNANTGITGAPIHTLSMMFQTTGNGQDIMDFCFEGIQSADKGLGFHYELSTNKIRYFDEREIVLYDKTTEFDGNWHRITMVTTAPGGVTTLTVYYDGNKVINGSTGLGSTNLTDAVLRIGWGRYSNNSYDVRQFTGIIDDVWLVSRAITDEEEAAIRAWNGGR